MLLYVLNLPTKFSNSCALIDRTVEIELVRTTRAAEIFKTIGIDKLSFLLMK